jgi:hypothetical protein
MCRSDKDRYLVASTEDSKSYEPKREIKDLFSGTITITHYRCDINAIYLITSLTSTTSRKCDTITSPTAPTMASVMTTQDHMRPSNAAEASAWFVQRVSVNEVFQFSDASF